MRVKLFAGKSAIVTGALTGIGKAIAESFANLGAAVTLSGRDEEKGKQMERKMLEEGHRALYVHADLLDSQSPELIVEETVRKFGRLDMVVHSAAMICHKPLEEVTSNDWDMLLQVNLKSPFFLVQAALPYLKESQGNVIFISSTNAWGNLPNNVVYDASKAALNHMCRGISLDLRPFGIRVNTIMPGGTRTPLLDRWLDKAVSESDERKSALSGPNLATPEQIADATVLVASGMASWINGANIPVDGGYHI